MALYELEEEAPRVASSAWVAESAEVIGRVNLAHDVSVWFNAVLRASGAEISVGRGSNVQDNCVLHADAGAPLVLGEHVTVGHRAVLTGCSVGDGALIGIRAVVLAGARIGRQCVVAAGAVVPEGKAYSDGMLIIGSPARAIHKLTPEELALLASAGPEYVELSERYARRLKQFR